MVAFALLSIADARIASVVVITLAIEAAAGAIALVTGLLLVGWAGAQAVEGPQNGNAATLSDLLGGPFWVFVALTATGVTGIFEPSTGDSDASHFPTVLSLHHDR